MVIAEIMAVALGSVTIPRSAVTTWGVMFVLVAVALLVRRSLRDDVLEPLQNVFETFMEQLLNLIKEILGTDPKPYVPMVGTLFLFIFVANLVGMIPGLSSPMADLTVTDQQPSADLSVPAALAVVVFFSVPFYGVRSRGLGSYLKIYLQPNPFMLPFNILGEITRTLSLAVRLFGNIMSGEFLMLVVIAVVTTLLRGYARVFLPFTFILTLFLSVLSLITAAIQAYIFTVLALVYIGAAVERRPKPNETQTAPSQEGAS